MISDWLCIGASGAAAVVWGILAWVIVRGQRSIVSLSRVAPSLETWPPVSVIIPIRNEERHLDEALRSVLALDYSPLEILAINDRSTDGTSGILTRLASEYPRLKVLTISELPGGWLGKNHALHRGAQAASGELLLFTDADVLMETSVLRRAVSFLSARGLDHLAVSPRVTSSGFLMQHLMGCFTLNFSLYAWPWKARDPGSSMFMGIGAFNLIRAGVYRAIGGHSTLAMNPIDDMMIGKRVKQQGCRQDIAYGLGLLELEWYATPGEFVKGLEKNAFAGARYRVTDVVAGTVILLALEAWPFLGVWMIPSTAGWLCAGAAMLAVIVCADHARAQGYPVSSGFLFPFSGLFGIYVVWRAMLLALWHGGVQWRGTRYPLSSLRQNLK